MTVTKQQQLEWLAKECHTWKGRDFILVSDTELGYRLPVTAGCHIITRKEWQQERDRQLELKAMTMQMCSIKPLEKYKVSSKPEVDNSWHERGELPPVWCECWYIPDGKPVFIAAKHCAIDAVIFSSAPGGGELCYGYRDEFRPLRTEREKAIDEMISVTLAVINQDTQRQMFGMLYDSGYRKVKP